MQRQVAQYVVKDWSTPMTHGMVLIELHACILSQYAYIDAFIYVHVLTACVGTKNVAKEVKKISEGRVRDRGVTWFPELANKRKY